MLLDTHAPVLRRTRARERSTLHAKRGMRAKKGGGPVGRHPAPPTDRRFGCGMFCAPVLHRPGATTTPPQQAELVLAVFCNCEPLMDTLHTRLSPYYASNPGETMLPINIAHIPTLYNGTTVLVMKEGVGDLQMRCVSSQEEASRYAPPPAPLSVHDPHPVFRFFPRSPPSSSYREEVMRIALIRTAPTLMHHVIAIQCDTDREVRIDDACKWMSSVGVQTMSSHPQVSATLAWLCATHQSDKCLSDQEADAHGGRPAKVQRRSA